MEPFEYCCVQFALNRAAKPWLKFAEPLLLLPCCHSFNTPPLLSQVRSERLFYAPVFHLS